MALKGAAHGTVIAAERQTSEGDAWAGALNLRRGQVSIFQSLCVPGRISKSSCSSPPRRAGGRVSRHPGTHRAMLQAEIKWVNDIYIDGKKVCGILTEAITDFETGSLESVVAGNRCEFQNA